MINFPTSLDSLTNPVATDSTIVVHHATQHADENDAIEALETKVGINSSADTASLDYKVKSAGSVNPGHLHTLAAGLSDVVVSSLVNNDILYWSSSNARWQNGHSDSILPAGAIFPYAGPSAPSGWLLANGATVSQTTYSVLFALFGHTYGADPGGGNFILPDLRTRVPVGYKAADDTFGALGNAGGEKTHQLIVSEMPAHTHSKPNTYYGPSGSNHFGSNGQVGGSDGTVTGSTGGDDAHNNLQPYLTINYIIKT